MTVRDAALMMLSIIATFTIMGVIALELDYRYEVRLIDYKQEVQNESCKSANI